MCPSTTLVWGALLGAGAWRTDAWSSETVERTERALGQMSLSEKVALLHGSGARAVPGGVGYVAPNRQLGIPPLVMANGPQGWGPWAGAHGNSTCWPSGLTIAATFDQELAGEWGAAMGAEFFAKGTNVQLGPDLNVARVPSGGRNFESLSGEDPFLGYTLSQPVVRGIQGNHVLAVAKHWILNNQETDRFSDDAVVDERTRHELYYPPFEGAVSAGVAAVMCSYNRVGGAWSCGSQETLTDALKGRLGFGGFVVSDWGATHGVDNAAAGLDMEQPGAKFMGDALLAEVRSGAVPEAVVDASARRVLQPMYEYGIFEHAGQWENLSRRSLDVTSPAHSALARRLAAAAAVLARNEGALPVPAAARRIAVIGDQAREPTVHGDGSGAVFPTYVVSPLRAIQERAALGGGTVVYDDGSDEQRAASVAAEADLVVVVVGGSSREGSDRPTLALPGSQDALVRAVAAAAGGRTVVACISPGAVLLPWAQDVSALLLMLMPGLEVGNALADVLWGEVNPSGRLPVTMPGRDNEVNFSAAMFPGVDKRSTYSERLLVGYRWYDAHGVAPRYPFGHGLSYTRFEYHGLSIDASALLVSCSVTNAGRRAGSEVAQLYLAFPAHAASPPQQLRGFVRTGVLAPGESAQVSFRLRARDVSAFDPASREWAVVPGEFEARVGASSRDVRLVGRFSPGAAEALLV